MNGSAPDYPQIATVHAGRAEDAETAAYIPPTFIELGDFAELTMGTGTIAVEPLAFGFNG
ncbi:lasso RiPP family leader peptide-containing protein [Streptomyces sp. SCL15-4]|uniref:lasso RiPP family leader peptide-containing protein n=1 Tax=Streptomyces sp. SCL15-4 TaxID=2967221 RepID=UPI002965EF8C|nr:lasso RiPP family leader peptide-containing protein [Streptomyces sp. SCL15-4]